jgi:hypothetical protein
MIMYKELLKSWCDALLNLQIKESKYGRIKGGIMCPSCMRVHGRSADAMLPMLTMYKLTADKKYLESAEMLFDWSEYMVRPDGSYNNDTNSNWNGITVFAMIQLGECLSNYRNIIGKASYQKWYTRFLISAEYIREHIEEIGGNINYPVTASHAMAIAYELTHDERFAKKAKTLADFSVAHITDEGLLYGEGHDWEEVTPKGCRPVDMGYNMEESIPALISYADMMKDEDIMEIAVRAAKKHMEFIMPDGGLDNSFGSRSYKWSYWGSRTSDGCQAGFARLAKQDTDFAEVIYRNTKLLLDCTHDGLLYGGPMYYEAKESPCVHHTICHAKALSYLVENEIYPEGGNLLPIEHIDGVIKYPSISTYKVVKNGWYATITDYDCVYTQGGHPTGGSISLLWHEQFGPVMAGSMEHYRQVEPNNLQMPKYQFDINTTPRIEKKIGKQVYTSSMDLTAFLTVKDKGEEGVKAKAAGQLRSISGQNAGGYELCYKVKDDFEIKGFTLSDETVFIFPVILSSKNTDWSIDGYTFVTRKDDYKIRIEASENIWIPDEYINVDKSIRRLINPIGGFEMLPLRITLKNGEKFAIKIKISKI